MWNRRYENNQMARLKQCSMVTLSSQKHSQPSVESKTAIITALFLALHLIRLIPSCPTMGKGIRTRRRENAT